MTPQRVKPNHFDDTKQNPPGRARHFTTKEQPTIIRETGGLMLPPISSTIIKVIGSQAAGIAAGSFLRSSRKAATAQPIPPNKNTMYIQVSGLLQSIAEK